MKKNVKVASYVVWLIAISSIAGCEKPTEPIDAPRNISLTVTGDAPLYIEYSYDDALIARQVQNITTGSTLPQGWERRGLPKKGSSFRLYAISKVPDGHVRAYVLVSIATYDQMLLQVLKENDGGAVEITGTVP
jgi:hypothetical protein